MIPSETGDPGAGRHPDAHRHPRQPDQLPEAPPQHHPPPQGPLRLRQEQAGPGPIQRHAGPLNAPRQPVQPGADLRHRQVNLQRHPQQLPDHAAKPERCRHSPARPGAARPGKNKFHINSKNINSKMKQKFCY